MRTKDLRKLNRRNNGLVSDQKLLLKKMTFLMIKQEIVTQTDCETNVKKDYGKMVQPKQLCK